MGGVVGTEKMTETFKPSVGDAGVDGEAGHHISNPGSGLWIVGLLPFFKQITLILRDIHLFDVGLE